jgi:chromosome partitioning protein
MMAIFVFSQSKGGVGKTTLAINFADELSIRNQSTMLVDADPQGNSAQWAAPHKLLFPVRHEVLLRHSSLIWVRDVLKSTTQHVVVDTPAGLGFTFEVAALIADVLIIPCGPSSLDIDSAAKTVKKARDLRGNEARSRALRIILAPNRVDLSTEEGLQIPEALKELDEEVAPAVRHDIDYVRTFASGTSVVTAPNRVQAAEDIRKLTTFIASR